MESGEEARFRTIAREYAAKVKYLCFRVSRSRNGKLFVAIGPHGYYVPFSFSQSPAALLRLLVDITESECSGNWSIDFHLVIDADVANEILRIVRDNDRKSKLDQVTLGYVPSEDAIPVIASLFSSAPCSLNCLVMPAGVASSLSDMQPHQACPCPFTVSLENAQDMTVSTVTTFAANARLKRLALFGWPIASEEDPIAPMPDLEYLRADPMEFIRNVDGAVRSIVALLSSCPNLFCLHTSLTGSLNDANARAVLSPMIAQLKGLRALDVRMKDIVLQPDMITSLSTNLTSLQELVMSVMGIGTVGTPDELDLLATSHPRLFRMSIYATNEGARGYDDIIRRKREWLLMTALSTYLPLGDLHRELSEYF
jgi:hypothetical protein